MVLDFFLISSALSFNCLSRLYKPPLSSALCYHEGVCNINESQTVGLEDDRLTEEVLRDLGLMHNGPNENNIIATAYHVWTKDTEGVYGNGLGYSDPLEPPGFEQNGPEFDGEQS